MTEHSGSRLAEHYAGLAKMREMMETMKTNQAYRGVEGLNQRIAARAKHTTWRQMKGIQLFMHEINHPGNKPFMIGLGVTVSAFLYAYYLGVNSEQAKRDSTYYQRFHAKHDHH